MGCCCPKEKNNQNDLDDIANERTRLLSADQKSRFVDNNSLNLQQNQISNLNLGTNNNEFFNPNFNDPSSFIDNQLINQQNLNNKIVNINDLNQPQNQNVLSESNQMFEKILSEVIHVSSAYEQRSLGLGLSAYQTNDLMEFSSAGLNLNLNETNQVNEMPFKMKGLLEAQALNKQQQLVLPDGVPAPFSVLAAQPPFSNDIKLINNLAQEASNCISNFTLMVPENVAFDFKPMFSVYKSVHSPSGVDNSIFCNFLNSKESNLIVSCTNKLLVYKFFGSNNIEECSNVKENKLRFELVETFYLYGNISSIKSCRYGSMAKDALIIAFSDAKLSIVEYNSELGDLKTLSIHYFEEELGNDGIYYNIFEPILKVDPNMRCACMLIFGFKLVVIPFFNLQDKELNSNLGFIRNYEQDFRNEQGLKSENDFSQISSSLSSYIIDLRKLDNWLEMRIIDIEFLFGYYEPTLFILCESNMTWVGRYAVKKDTCNSVAISLNLNQKTHPVIWPVDKLPSDCLKCFAVPSPIGGIIILAINSLIYINQSVPTHAISLNSLASRFSSYPFKNNQENLKITLDSSQGCFISHDELCVSLKNGELYIFNLITDSESLRSVKDFKIEKCASSVISSCLSKCFDNYLFVGSRLGNSVLLKYSIFDKRSTKDVYLNGSINFNFPTKELTNNPKQINKKNNQTINYYDNNMDINLDSFNNEEDFNEKVLNQFKKLNNNRTENEKLSSASYSFEICDILLNIAPCGNSLIGESVGDYSDYFDISSIHLNQIDLVTSSGFTKNGAISVLQRSLRPDIIASFQIPDIIDMWPVNLSNLKENNTTIDENSITYLFLSKLDSTIILQIGGEITELEKENCTFQTNEPTLCVSILNNKKYITQITSKFIYLYSCIDDNKIILIKNFKLLDYISEYTIKQVSILDPYVCILDENGKIFLMYFDAKSQNFFSIDQNDKVIDKKINCFCFYEDTSKIFSTYLEISNLNLLYQDNLKKTKQESDQDENNYSHIKLGNEKLVNYDEDELLYGSSYNNISSFKETQDIANLLNEKKKTLNCTQINEKTNKYKNLGCNDVCKPILLFIITLDGSLLIYKINFEKNNQLSLLFSFSQFYLAPKLIKIQNNTAESKPSFNDFMSDSQFIKNNQTMINLKDIIVISCGYQKNKAYLVILFEEDLVIYETFLSEKANELNYSLILKKTNHEIIVRDKRYPNKKNNFKTRTTKRSFLKEFDNIAGFNGFACIGTFSSYLVFYCPRSGLTPHPLWFDSNLPITSFVPFKNSSITLSGFIYINKNSDIRICSLPIDDCNGKLQIYYDFPWVLKKIQIRQTINFVCYHEESKTYAVCYNQGEQTNKLMTLGDEDKEVIEFDKDERFILPIKTQFFIQIYTPIEWEPLPLGKYELLEWEHVSCLKTVHLPYEGHSSGIRSYLAASTINCFSEDVNSRGRILLFDIIETVPEPDKPLTNRKIKVILEKEQKGPVTCIESVNAHLIGCVGQKIFIWEYKNNELIGKAFIDTHFYVHKMVVLKNFVLIADLHKSISLIRFQEEYAKLSFVAKDKYFVDTYACEFLVDNSNLGFIATDSEKNLSVFMYQSESHDNQGGNWLIRKAEFNVGSHINTMFRLKCKVIDPYQDKRSSLADKRQVTYCNNLDGGIGFLLPISEKVFRRLFILQNTIIAIKSHYAGLNPKSFRMWRGKRKELLNPQKNILDGDLLFEFFSFSYTEKIEIAKKIKTNIEQLLDDLTEIYQLSSHF